MADITRNVGTPRSGLPIRFLSWNVKGLGHQIKRSKVLSHLKHLKADIAFIQETHMRPKDHMRLRKSWVNQIFHSNFNSKSRGVAILVHKRIQFIPTNTISDPNGRYLIITGSLFQTPVLLVNVYAPNFDNASFANKLLSSLPSLNTHLLILGGDLNCAMDPHLDRSNPRTTVPSAMSRAFSDFMLQNGCADAWRFQNPNVKEYSFLSPVHRSYSRIDYLFVDSKLLPNVLSTQYHAIVISDHAPLSVDIRLQPHSKTRPIWRFNSLLLSDQSFCDQISSSIDSFLITNRTDSISHSLIWESLKAFLRGQIISYSANLSKQHNLKISRLTKSILNLDHQYALHPTPELYKERLNLQTEFDLLTTKQEEHMLLQSRGNEYEHGEKAGRLLAHQLKRQAASRLIPQIRDTSDNLLCDPADINATFKSFYSTLYKSEFPSNTIAMDRFLNNLNPPTVNPATANELDSQLKLHEVVNAINSMQSKKAPGPDGYPTEFFKRFSDKIAPILLDVYKESMERGTLPPTLTQASISVLLKKDKDPTQCSSYRPLSLLNVDAKVLAKVLANRLEKIVPDIISKEQTGFIKGRQSFFNIRTLMNIIYSNQSTKPPELVISLDAEKAFDRIEWEYLFAVLSKFGFGNRFISWIRLLYTNPLASVCTNDTRSDYFKLSRGSRQGCPLSPLLFALAIEPLSITLRSSTLFQGILRGGIEYRVSLYADDLLLYITNPAIAIPNVISILHDFSSFSGYKLNLQKSECFPLNITNSQLQQLNLPFKIAHSGFKYLGVHVTRSQAALLAANFTPLLSQTNTDFQRWKNLPLTLTGRINVVKMTILPKFLYLFQTIPLYLPKSFFHSLNKLITTFIWAGKHPRINRTTLEESKADGGLALPNFMHYYWAANIQKILYWLHDTNTTWHPIEANSCISTSLPALLCSPYPISLSQFTKNQVVLASLKIWFQFRRHFKFSSASTLGPITNNHRFPPSVLDSSFSLWKLKGITCFQDLYNENILSSFTFLSNKYTLPSSHLFRYFQVRHYLSTEFPSFPSLPVTQPWEVILKFNPNQNSLISKIYTSTMSLINNTNTGKNRATWERETNITFSDNWWGKAIERVFSSTSCARLSLIQFKVLHRIHYSKARLAEIYPNVDNRCDRCNHAPADLSHMFFLCPTLHTFWVSYFQIISEVLSLNLEPCPQIAIFGVPRDTLTLQPTHADVIAFSSLLARRRILLMWKSPSPPSISTWLVDMMFFLKLEKIKFTTRGSIDKFQTRWQPFISHFNNLETLPSD